MSLNIAILLIYLLVINTFENAYLLGICLFLTMILSNVILYLIKKVTYNNIKIPVSLIVTGTIVTVLEMIIMKYIPNFYNDIYLYFPLLMLTTFDYDSDDSFGISLKKIILKSLKYIIILVLVVGLKEIISTNHITFMNNISNITKYRSMYKVLPDNKFLPLPILSKTSGCFIFVGMCLGIINKIGGNKND